MHLVAENLKNQIVHMEAPLVVRLVMEQPCIFVIHVQIHVQRDRSHPVVPARKQLQNPVRPSVVHNVIPVHAQAITSTHVAVPAIPAEVAQLVTVNTSLATALADMNGKMDSVPQHV